MIRRHNAKIKNDNPNNNNKNNEQSLDVINYLIQKLESRQKKIFKYKNLLEELDSFETFYSKRKEIYLLLNNLEEDLKQASFAIKALMLQNKSLIKDINTKLSENKILSNKLNLTIGENQNMKVKLENINKKENQFNEMVNYDINNNSNNNLINVDINSIKVDEEGEYDEPKIKNINLNVLWILTKVGSLSKIYFSLREYNFWKVRPFVAIAKCSFLHNFIGELFVVK